MENGLTVTAQGRGRRRRGSVEEAELDGGEAEKAAGNLLFHLTPAETRGRHWVAEDERRPWR
jgi:hypothetical protein